MSEASPNPSPEPVDAGSPVGSPEDRRTAPRLALDQLVGVMLVDASGEFGPVRVVRAIDVSTGGVAVRCEHMMHEGAIGVVQFIQGDGRIALVGCEVRHCRYLEDGQHQIGIMFTKLDASIDARQFLDDAGQVRLLHADLAPPPADAGEGGEVAA